ncbi:sigma-70 family RNA polymerase sigma factor [Actinoplanes sp. NPDC026670]|uniref:sigma-70 family RNA polymerase sigma factor n=1 Tax=Actinoplanes sp. NPDC026670 TaxID=3154700 RepID=UPI0033EF43B6
MRSPQAHVPVDRVVAAQRGDRDAMQQLITDHLTMLYNVAGRALNGHTDADDVVQETLLRVVENIGSLREPARFSGWILAILQRQIAERLRRRHTVATRTDTLDTAPHVADPDSDFTDVAILRLGLSGQRRQAAQATRWLDPADRLVLSLWWLEVAGTITRADLVTALSATPGHAAVRVTRMREQFELSRAIVAALGAEPRCPQLAELADPWNGEPSSVWRKRLGRHLRKCAACSAYGQRLAPSHALLAGIAMVPVPASLTTGSLQLATPSAVGVGGAYAASWLSGSALAKVAAAGAAVVISGAALVVIRDDSGTPRTAAPPAVATGSAAPVTGGPTQSPSRPPASPANTATSIPAARYGSVVDTAEQAPPKNAEPGVLPQRPQTTVTVVSSNDEDPRADVVSLIRRGQSVTYRGRGYLRIEWAVAYTQRTGTVTMPSWTGLDGKIFHVASGGGRRLDDQIPGTADGTSGMGDPTHGTSVLPGGAQQMWLFEYYYLDGEVTLTSNERGADYNLYLQPATRAQINDDLRNPPGPEDPIRYGLLRDDGTDATPVPQYATRDAPADPATVAQRSRL